MPEYTIRDYQQGFEAGQTGEHRPYEPVYQQLGFKKAGGWAHVEKILTV
jgi:hypothetical protein